MMYNRIYFNITLDKSKSKAYNLGGKTIKLIYKEEMIMKKVLALVLAGMMIFMLASCDTEAILEDILGDELLDELLNESDAEKDENNDKIDEEEEDKNGREEEDSKTDREEEESKTDREEETEKQDDGKKAELSRGVVDGNTYTNNYLGFSFTKPDSWVYYSDEEIASLMNMSVDMMLGENFKYAFEQIPMVYDMMAVDYVSGSSVSMAYEKLVVPSMTEEQYVAALERTMAGVSGMTVIFPDASDYETVKIGDTEFLKVACTTTSNGVTMTQVYYLYKVDGYMSFILVTAANGYNASDIEAMFGDKI